MKVQPQVILIPLTNDQFALIDESDFDLVSKYKWRAVKYRRSYYARASYRKNNKTHSVSMHRLIAQTPAAQICHHRNRNSLDNRRINLLNMIKHDHQFLHKNNSLIIKFVGPGFCDLVSLS